MKNRTYFKLFAGLLVSMAMIFCWLPAPVFSAEFSANIVITGPVDSYTFKLQVKDNMYRLRKIKGPMNVPPFPSIVNRDTGVTWGLNDQMRQYVEIRDIEKTMMMNPLVGWAMTRKGMTESPGPTETMNGYKCETRLYTETGKSETAAKVWISKKLNHIIRDERFGMNKNPVLELQNIQRGPVDSALFQIPAGYTKMDMGGGPGSKSAGTTPKQTSTASGKVSPTPPPKSQPEPAPNPKTSDGGAAPSSGSDEQKTGGDTIMNGEVPLMEGAKVLKTKTYGPNAKVELEVQASPEEIINFYKQAMTAKEWQAVMAMVQGNIGILTLKQSGRQLVFKVKGQGQTSKVSMALIGQ